VVGGGVEIVVRRRVAPGFLILAVVFTVVVWRAPGLDVAYGSEGMHIALAAVVATVAVVVGGLAWLRYLRSGLLVDLTAALAFAGVIAGENIFALAVPTLLNHEVPVPSAVWTAAALEVVAALLLAVGIAGGSRRVKPWRAVILVAVVTALAATLAATMVALGPSLSLPIDPAVQPVGLARHAFEGSTIVLALHGLTGLLMFAAGMTIVIRAREGGEVLFGWLAVALLVGAVAAFNYALFPSLYSYWVYSGDLLRLCFCIALAVGIIFELRASLRRAIDLAVLEERRRLARDLHDGAAQELAFIASELGDIPDGLHPSLRWIRSAAERGLWESRRAIAALTLPLDRPFPEELAASIEEITRRGDVSLSLAIDQSIDLPQHMEDAILRVAREAVLNAVQHAQPSQIHVGLNSSGNLRLEVADDGRGFDEQKATRGFGLTSIRERTELSGGRFDVQSRPGLGTRVTATWLPVAPTADSI
jgi:signal transduction histidine kinase